VYSLIAATFNLDGFQLDMLGIVADEEPPASTAVLAVPVQVKLSPVLTAVTG
jgi:hypothetical protein